MNTLKGYIAHQGLLLRVTGVVKGEGAEKRDGVTHDQGHHQQFEYCLGQVDLNKWNKGVMSKQTQVDHTSLTPETLCYLIDDIRAFTVGPKLPDPFEQRSGLFSITFTQTDHLSGAVNHEWRIGGCRVNLGAEGFRRHGGVTGEC